MRNLAYCLALAIVTSGCCTPAALAQRQRQQQPATAAAPVHVEPNWNGVRTSQKAGQVQSVEQLQGAIRQQSPPNKREGTLLVNLPKFVSEAAAVNAAVLIPLTAARAENTALVTGKTFYNFSAAYSGGMSSTVLGMCTGMRLPDGHPLLRSLQAEVGTRPVLPGLGEAYQLSDTEGGRRLSFSKFNCAYEIEVICEASCDADRELKDMASSMAVINAR